MTINLLWHLLLLMSLMYTAGLSAHESIKPPHPITSLGIAVNVIHEIFTHSHYKVIGTCTWATGKFPPTLIPIPAVGQFLPDFVVTVANRPETNPWIEANRLFENLASLALYQRAYKLATGFPLSFGNKSAQLQAMHINEERTRVVNVIGSPAGFYQVPYLSHQAETKFGLPYYLSEADAVSDRTEIAELMYMATHPQLLINHDIGQNGHSWGHESPRLMRVSNPSRFRASVVAAMHALDIVTNKNSLHVTKSTTNSCGPNCVVANAVFNPTNTSVIWQEVYPINRTIHPGAADDFGVEDEKKGNGNYVFVVWRKYRGCIKHEGKLIRSLSFPKVGLPQKR